MIYVSNIQNEYWLSIYEITLISKYKPIYNKNDLYETDTFIDIPQLNWIPYLTEEETKFIYSIRTGNIPDNDMLDNPVSRWKLLNSINGGKL